MGRSSLIMRKKRVYEIYQDAAEEWRWRLKAANHKILADSGEGYKEQRKCLEAVERLKQPTDLVRIV